MEQGPRAPRNIALTGHYGSGKSSVIEEVEKRLAAKGVKCVKLSLPSLGANDGRLGVEPKQRDLTNLIQKEIVKQLLYLKAPSKMPASRYRRLDVFPWRSTLGWAFVVALVAGFAGLIADLPGRLTKVLPEKILSGGQWVPWSGLVVVVVVSAGVFVALARLLHQRVRIEKFSAGPAAVALTNQNNTYFDEYLDEIVYFFQRSKTSVAIFEDLDRFKDPHIFETLRELNALLNNSEQIKKGPVRFVYATRDSIFEEPEKVDAGTRGDDAKISVIERLGPTNRAKFFDLVIPMVPFISHRTARDLITRELRRLDESRRPSKGVVDLVGAYLTDMRLIKNICNEYEIFSEHILGGLDALKADQLFAMMVYKNLYLGDFEKIREGKSRLDAVYRHYREVVNSTAKGARKREQEARVQAARLDEVAPTSEQYGKRLRGMFQAINVVNGRVTVGGQVFSFARLETPEFWRTFLREGFLTTRHHHGEVRFDVQTVEAILGVSLSVEDWAERDRVELQKKIRSEQELARNVVHETMAAVLGHPELVADYCGKNLSLARVAEVEFRGEELPLLLLRKGYLDENFTIYVADYPAVTLGVSAMNFILHAVQVNRMDVDYLFDSVDEVKAVIREAGDRLLNGDSVYNVAIFDHLLEANPELLSEPLARLARDDARVLDFVLAYTASGAHVEDFVERLSPHWPKIFSHIASVQSDDRFLGMLDAALRGADLEVDYEVDAAERSMIEQHYKKLDVFLKPSNGDQDHATVASLLAKFEVTIGDISVVFAPLRAQLVERNLYPVTDTNLAAALGPDECLALDQIKKADENVYHHVLEHLADYLGVGVETVSDPASFVEVLKDVAERSPDSIEEVARGAGDGCLVQEISSVDPSMWPALARSSRFPTTVANVKVYAAKHNVDAALADHLAESGTIAAGTESDEVRLQLAVLLVNSSTLAGSVKVELLKSLGLSSRIGAAQIERRSRDLIPELVEHGLVSDDVEAFRCLSSKPWATKEKLVQVSENFVDYLPELELSSGDVVGIVSSDVVGDDAKKQLLERLDAIDLDEQAAQAVLDWVNAASVELLPEQLEKLREAGASVEPEEAVDAE